MGDTCQRCGKEFKIDINISDNIWNKIKPDEKPNESDLLCPMCIILKLEKLGKYNAFRLEIISEK